MTNTLTTDIKGTINQIHFLEEVGADIVRVSCPDERSTKVKKLLKKFQFQLLLIFIFIIKEQLKQLIMGASCLRINPGNIGDDNKIKEVIKAAKDNNCSLRIGC